MCESVVGIAKVYPAYDFVSGRRPFEEEEVHESLAGIAFCEIQDDLEIAEVERSVPCIAFRERKSRLMFTKVDHLKKRKCTKVWQGYHFVRFQS